VDEFVILCEDYMAASKKVTFFSIIGAILVIGLAGVCVYFFVQYRTVNSELRASKDPKIDLQLTIDRVKHHVLLPTNEIPTVATVSNVEALKSQAFFANAKNGDKVLVYTNAKKAYLYDPVADIVVEVGPIVITPPSPTPGGPILKGTPPSAGVPSPTPKVLRAVVYNGTTQPNLADSFIMSIRDKVANIFVVEKGTAVKTNYASTLVIPLATEKQTEIQAVATAIGATFQKDIPAGETQPINGDVLIIIGSDNLPKGP